MLTLAVVGSVAAQDDPGSDGEVEEVLVGTPLEMGDLAPFSGTLMSREDEGAVIDYIEFLEEELRLWGLQFDVAEAERNAALAMVEEIKSQNSVVRGTLDLARAELEGCLASKPGWFERHVGFCVGVGFYWDPFNERGGGAAEALYGLKW